MATIEIMEDQLLPNDDMMIAQSDKLGALIPHHLRWDHYRPHVITLSTSCLDFYGMTVPLYFTTNKWRKKHDE